MGAYVSENIELAVTAEDASRRRFLKQAAAVTFATPVVVTMLSNSAKADHATCGTVVITGDIPGCSGGATCGTGGVCTPPTPPTPGAACTCVHPAP
jgi:hypothetical protein